MNKNNEQGYKRDLEIINYLDIVKISSGKQIKELFFKDNTNSIFYRRMEKLAEQEKIYRTKYEGNKYLYHYDKKCYSKKAIKHELEITKVYLKLLNIEDFEVLTFKKSFSLNDNVIPDIFVQLKYNNMIYNIFFEIQLSKTIMSSLQKYYINRNGNNFRNNLIEHNIKVENFPLNNIESNIYIIYISDLEYPPITQINTVEPVKRHMLFRVRYLGLEFNKNHIKGVLC